MKLEEYAKFLRYSAMSIIEEVGDYTFSELSKGLKDPHHVREVLNLNNIYFGATSFREKQKVAREAAFKRDHSMSTMLFIETYVEEVTDPRTAWNLRALLCDTPEEEMDNVAECFFQVQQATQKRGWNRTF